MTNNKPVYVILLSKKYLEERDISEDNIPEYRNFKDMVSLRAKAYPNNESELTAAVKDILFYHFRNNNDGGWVRAEHAAVESNNGKRQALRRLAVFRRV